MTQAFGLKATVHNLFFVGLTLIVIGWLSVFMYGMFYYVYIPAVSHVRPVFLQFETSCQTGVCTFPSANVTLGKRGQDQLLARGQPYKIVLDLEMPESETNRRLGMFMVKLSMYARDGQVLKSSFRSALLHYKSPLLRFLYTLVFSPFLLVGSAEEKQIVSVSLFESYEEDPEKAAYGAFVELHSRTVEVYSAFLRIHADFTGLRYYMYYWPGLSTAIGVGTNVYFLVLIALFSWYRFLLWREKGVSLPPIESASSRVDSIHNNFTNLQSDGFSLELDRPEELNVQEHSLIDDLAIKTSTNISVVKGTSRLHELSMDAIHTTDSIDASTSRIDDLSLEAGHITNLLDQGTPTIDDLSMEAIHIMNSADQSTSRIDDLTIETTNATDSIDQDEFEDRSADPSLRRRKKLSTV